MDDNLTAMAFLATLNEADLATSFMVEVAKNNKLYFIEIELIKHGKQLMETCLQESDK